MKINKASRKELLLISNKIKSNELLSEEERNTIVIEELLKYIHSVYSVPLFFYIYCPTFEYELSISNKLYHMKSSNYSEEFNKTINNYIRYFNKKYPTNDITIYFYYY